MHRHMVAETHAHTHAHTHQVNEAAEVIYDMVDPNANLIFGAVVDPSMSEEVSITIIATGFTTAEESLSSSNAAGRVERAAPRPAVVAAAPVAQPVAAVAAAAAPHPFGGEAPRAAEGVSNIEIPAFLRRRRLQGK